MRHIIIIFAILCASCSGYAIKPYRMDIQQGNVVTSKMMLQLRPGMSKSQVRFIMGTPLIQDSFHKDRWDYFYQFRKDGKIVEQRLVVLEFDNEQLARVRGDVVPANSGQEQAATPEESKAGKTVVLPPAAVKKEKGFLDKLKFWKSDDEPAEQPQAAPAELVTPPAPAAVAPAAKPAPAPEPAKPEPAPAVEPKPEAAPAPEPAAEPIAAPVPNPAPEAPVKPAEPAKTEQPAAAPVPAQQPAAKSTTEPASKPVAKPVVKPAAKPAPAAEPEKELPPEDEPGYFERMLEKIGF